MIARLVALALAHRLAVCLLWLAVSVLGVASWRALRIDALPDLTNNQVQVLTEARGLAPAEVEKLVTFPLETAMQGLPKVAEIRSTSKFALSVITIVFDDSVEPYFARQLVFERLQSARPQLPALAEPALGPMASGMGEIYMYALTSTDPKFDAMALRTLQDWVVRPQLRTVRGVAEVNGFGGLVRQAQVLVDPAKLQARGLTFADVTRALEETRSAVGGNFVVQAKEQYIVRGLGLAESLDDLRKTVLSSPRGAPVFVGDIATVKFGPEVRQGAVTADGKGEVVSGIVMMLRGENSREVIERVKAKVTAIREALPPGVTLAPYYDQTELVDRTIRTVMTNLLEGGLLVVAVLFAFLRNVRAALLVAATIPLSMGVAFIGMRYAGLSANLMSLGAIDFGLIVDGAIVMVENAMRRLREPHSPTAGREAVVGAAAQEVARPIFFGVLVIVLVYLPILTLQGMAGKMFVPMALTVGFALLGSLALALTLIPVLATWLLPVGGADVREPGMDRLRSGYGRALDSALRHRVATVVTASVMIGGSLALVPSLGTEFLPEMDEGSLLIQAIRLPSIALDESLRTQGQIEKILLGFPEVGSVVSRTGRPDIASDPMGVNMTDTFVTLKPTSTWRYRDKDALQDAMRTALGAVPGVNYNFTQPIAMRVDELVSGVKSDVAVKVFGEDLRTLTHTAEAIAAAVRKVPGAREVNVQQIEGQTYMDVRPDRDALARFGLGVGHIQNLVEGAIGGRVAGELADGQRRLPVVVRLPESERASRDAVARLRVDVAPGGSVPLSEVARVELAEGPAEISREDAQRLIVVEANVVGRDVGSFVAEAQRAVRAHVTVPPTYFVTWGGQFEHQEQAMQRLMIVVPLAIAGIFLLLYASFGSVGQAAIVLAILPLATVGGVLALWLRGLHLSVSASIGFIALFGIAVLNGIVLLETINRLRDAGAPVDASVREGAVTRLRPVLMTALVASLGFVPMAISTGAGAEIQRPLATVVIGGLLSATLLTLFVLPVIYAWVRPTHHRQ